MSGHVVGRVRVASNRSRQRAARRIPLHLRIVRIHSRLRQKPGGKLVVEPLPLWRTIPFEHARGYDVRDSRTRQVMGVEQILQSIQHLHRRLPTDVRFQDVIQNPRRPGVSSVASCSRCQCHIPCAMTSTPVATANSCPSVLLA